MQKNSTTTYNTENVRDQLNISSLYSITETILSKLQEMCYKTILSLCFSRAYPTAPKIKLKKTKTKSKQNKPKMK